MLRTIKKLRTKVLGKKPYQLRRFPQDQYKLISSTAAYRESGNSLEVGCNYGLLVEMLRRDGKFAVGIDATDIWRKNKRIDGLLGTFQLDQQNINQLPTFDIISILSVHHQIIAAHGDNYAQQILTSLLSKATNGLFIEFSALSEKYGSEKNSLFIDNDQESVKQYAEMWLEKICSSDKFDFLGKTRESQPTEPFRYLYLIRP